MSTKWSNFCGYFFIILFNFLAVILAETVKIGNKYCDYPIIIRYIDNLICSVMIVIPIITQSCIYRSKLQTSSKASTTTTKSVYRRDRQIRRISDYNRIEATPMSVSQENSIDSSFNSTPSSIIHDKNVNSNYKPATTDDELNYKLINVSMSKQLLLHTIGTCTTAGGGMLYYISMEGTSVVTSTTILRTRAIWSYIYSVILGKETFSLWKVTGIIIMFLGVACYVLDLKKRTHDSNSDTDSNNQHSDTLWGIGITLFCSMIFPVGDFTFKYCCDHSYYLQSQSPPQSPSISHVVIEPQQPVSDSFHAYTIAAKLQQPENQTENIKVHTDKFKKSKTMATGLIQPQSISEQSDKVDVAEQTDWMKIVCASHWHGMIGILQTFVFVWILFIPYNTSTDTFTTESSLSKLYNDIWKKEILFKHDAMLWIVINGGILTVCDTCLSIGNAYTTPLFVNIGTLIGIPMGFIIDMFWHNYSVSFYAIMGAVFIIVGFLIVNDVFKQPKCCKKVTDHC